MTIHQLIQAKPAMTASPSFTSLCGGLLQRKCACGGAPSHSGECEECRKKKLQRKTRNANIENRDDSAVPSIVLDVLRSPGRPLDADTRAYMEPRFGHDFSAVKVHTDSRAAESARAVNALAYTVGQSVVFGEGQFAPGSSSGRRLMAHELTHTVQQSRGGVATLAGSMRVSDSSDADEFEADAVASKVVTGSGVDTVATDIQPATPGIQRFGDTSRIPPGLEADCEIAADTPAAVEANLMFSIGSFAISALEEAKIERFVSAWTTAGATAPVRVDGYASILGTDELNWRLSCDRAQAVVNILMAPPSGISGVPAGSIRTVAQGETTEFGAEADNQRATISSPIALPPVPACANPGVSRTLDLQPVFLRTDPTDASPTGTSWPGRLNEANAIWGKVGVNFNDLGSVIVDTPLKTGGDADIASVAALRNGAGVEVLIVDNDLAGSGGASTLGPLAALCNTGKIVMSDRGTSDTLLAHELGHILGIQHPGVPPNPGDPGTIMVGSGSHSTANSTRNTMVNFNAILCPPATGSTCLNPDP